MDTTTTDPLRNVRGALASAPFSGSDGVGIGSGLAQMVRNTYPNTDTITDDRAASVLELVARA